jgi:hypothetical protein
MKRFVLLSAFLMIAGCGDDDVTPPVDSGTPLDLNTVDMPETDSNVPDVDAGPPPVTHSGTISLLEAKLLNPGTTGTFFGQGLQAGITFVSSTDVPAPVLNESPTLPTGCKAWVYTPAEAAIASIGNDEGPVQITSAAGTTPPVFPACSFVTGVGYACPDLTSATAGGTISAGTGTAAGLAMLTDAVGVFTAANTDGRYVKITGATNAANNGVFPIVALAAATTIVYGNTAFVAEALPGAATHVNLAGVGPIPNKADPGFLFDDNTAEFVLTPGAGNHFTAFTSTTGTGTVGDGFIASAATLSLLNAMPVDGSAITLGCEAGSCAAGSASGILVNIITTDAPTTGLSPFAMPLPTTQRVQIRCAQLSATSLTIPAAFSALLASSGATRIQTTLIRPSLMGGGPSSVSAISGHAIVGFTNP